MILDAKRTWLLSGALTLAGSGILFADSPGIKEISHTKPGSPFDPTTASGWKRPEKGIGLFFSSGADGTRSHIRRQEENRS